MQSRHVFVCVSVCLSVRLFVCEHDYGKSFHETFLSREESIKLKSVQRHTGLTHHFKFFDIRAL